MTYPYEELIAQLPEDIQDDMRDYLTHGRAPSTFLYNILIDNTSPETLDEASKIRVVRHWLHDYAPVLAWGKTTNVQTWLKVGGAEFFDNEDRGNGKQTSDKE